MHIFHTIGLSAALTTYLLQTHLHAYATFLPNCLSTSAVCTFLLLFTAGIAARLTYSILIYPHLLSPLRHIPGPKRVSIWNGQYPLMYGQPTGSPHIKWIDEVPNDGLIRYLAFLNGERVFPVSAKLLQEVMHTKSYQFEKPPLMRKSIGKALGLHGLLFSEGEQHKMQRKHILPAFSYRHLRDLVPTFWQKSLELVRAIEHDTRTTQDPDAGGPHGAKIELSQWLSRATLDIIGSAGFGYEFNCINHDDDSNELVKAYRMVFSPPTKGQMLFKLILQQIPDWIAKLIPSKRRTDGEAATEVMKAMCMKMVREAQRDYQTGGKVGQKGRPA